MTTRGGTGASWPNVSAKAVLKLMPSLRHSPVTRPIDRKRLGPPLGLTPEQLDHAAEVTPFDVAQARALWQQFAPPVFADLLDAVVATDDA